MCRELYGVQHPHGRVCPVCTPKRYLLTHSYAARCCTMALNPFTLISPPRHPQHTSAYIMTESLYIRCLCPVFPQDLSPFTPPPLVSAHRTTFYCPEAGAPGPVPPRHYRGGAQYGRPAYMAMPPAAHSAAPSEANTAAPPTATARLNAPRVATSSPAQPPMQNGELACVGLGFCVECGSIPFSVDCMHWLAAAHWHDSIS